MEFNDVFIEYQIDTVWEFEIISIEILGHGVPLLSTEFIKFNSIVFAYTVTFTGFHNKSL